MLPFPLACSCRAFLLLRLLRLPRLLHCAQQAQCTALVKNLARRDAQLQEQKRTIEQQRTQFAARQQENMQALKVRARRRRTDLVKPGATVLTAGVCCSLCSLRSNRMQPHSHAS